MRTIIPAVFSLAWPFLSTAAFAETKSPDDLKKCADLQAQKEAASKSRNPLFSQLRLKHIEAMMTALECPEPAPAPPKTSVSAVDKKP